jgi:ATP synthase F1 gamma subunit
MQNKQRINAEIELMGTLRLVTQAYEEIAVMRMQRIRDVVLHTRLFIGELGQVFYDVKSNYKSSTVEQMFFNKGKLKTAPTSMVEKNGKAVALLITTNAKLNGEIIPMVFLEFYKYVNENECDLVIVGKMGKQLYEQMSKKKPYTFFELGENQITNASLRELVVALLPYKDVNVFYGKFESLLFQNPTITNLSGEDKAKQKKADDKQVLYVFEPSIETILQFFETQIFSSLVKQTLNESELARYASRIRAMEEAMQNIDKSSKGLSYQRNKMKKLINNKKQLEIMSRVMIS